MNISKILGWLLLIAVCIVILGKYIWIPISIVLFIIIIRLFADLFWFGKDKDWW